MTLRDKVALVTGANAGLGFETALALHGEGARVVLAGRSEARLQQAKARIEASGPGGALEILRLDLASLASVREAAEGISQRHGRLDLLINNAGVMVPPPGKTEDGYELQFGINFVGHFALTGRLFPLLEATAGARVVTLSSIAHRGQGIDFGNLRLEKPYEPWREYGQSKLADLILALELDRRLRALACQLSSLAAHPGVSSTELTRNLDESQIGGVQFMSASDGAQPTLVAAISPEACGGQYYGPDGPEEKSGRPALARVDAAAEDPVLGARLWEWAQEATGVVYPRSPLPPQYQLKYSS